MAFRVLLVAVAFAILYGCGREGPPVGAQEAEAEGSAPSSEPRPLPDQSSQDALLQAYFDQMGVLLLDKGLNGPYDGGAKGHREVRTLARARTLAALERLDPARKRLVVLFLMEASLIQNAPGEEPVIGLVGADLVGVDLTYSAVGDAQPYLRLGARGRPEQRRPDLSRPERRGPGGRHARHPPCGRRPQGRGPERLRDPRRQPLGRHG
jgi:hypothetical protein